MAAIWAPLVRLEEIMGQGPARALATARGGNSVYIGQVPSAELVALCGDERAALALSKHYGGSDIVLPTALIRPDPKKTRIAALVEAGATNLEIVREVGCTARYVASVRSDLGRDGRPRPEPKRATIIAMLKARRKWTDGQIAEQTGAAPSYVSQLRSALKRGVA